MAAQNNAYINASGKRFHFDNTYINNPRHSETIILYQIGDLSCAEGHVIGEHKQYCYEISYVVSGKGFFYSNEKKYEVGKGNIFLNVPGEIHKIEADRIDPLRYFYMGFNFHTGLHQENPFSHIMKKFDLLTSPTAADKFGINEPFVNIFNEIINLKSYSNLMIKSYLDQIIITAYRDFYDMTGNGYNLPEGLESTKQIVYEVINYIDVNLNRIDNLSSISRELGYSYSYLSRVFTHETGYSIKEYFDRKRFEKAAELLKNSNMSITQIAGSLHYQSIHSFSKAFRNNFKLSPSEYQSLYRDDKK